MVTPPSSLALSALVRHCHSDLVQRASWSALPRWTRGALAAQIIVFIYGFTVHLAILLAGQAEVLDDELPGWLGAYFTSLTVLNLAAAVLLARRRIAGVVLGCAVLVSDAAANAYAVYGLGLGGNLAAAGQVIITVLAVLAVTTAPAVVTQLRSTSGTSSDVP